MAELEDICAAESAANKSLPEQPETLAEAGLADDAPAEDATGELAENPEDPIQDLEPPSSPKRRPLPEVRCCTLTNKQCKNETPTVS